MKTFGEIIKENINLENGDFLSDDEKIIIKIYDDVDRLTKDRNYFGIALFMPETIKKEEYERKGIYSLATFSGLRLWESAFRRNKQILLINHITGEAYIAPLYNNRKKVQFDKNEIKRTKPDGYAAQSVQSLCEKHTINNIFPFEKIFGKFVAYALYYDWHSEPASLKIINSNNTEPATILPDLPSAGQASAVITRSGKKKADIEEKYAIEISDTIDVESDSLPVKITFSVNLKKEWLSFQWENEKKPAPKALIPVSVFVTKHNQDQKKPVLWHWTVPVYSSQKVNEGDQTEGFLITDLFHEEHNIRVEREFLAWCVVGTHLFGPEKFVLKK